MKVALICAGIGYVVVQMTLLLAILTAAARPLPKFQPEQKPTQSVQKKEREEELELQLA
jgi:hypothetical protein